MHAAPDFSTATALSKAPEVILFNDRRMTSMQIGFAVRHKRRVFTGYRPPLELQHRMYLGETQHTYTDIYYNTSLQHENCRLRLEQRKHQSETTLWYINNPQSVLESTITDDVGTQIPYICPVITLHDRLTSLFTTE